MTGRAFICDLLNCLHSAIEYAHDENDKIELCAIAGVRHDFAGTVIRQSLVCYIASKVIDKLR